MAVDSDKLEKKPFIYLLSGAIPLIGGLALYINSMKDDTIEDLKEQLEVCQGEKQDTRKDYMDLFVECNDNDKD